jgi:hypothetical protein
MRIALTIPEAAPFRHSKLFHTIRQSSPDRIKFMKRTIFAFCFLCGTAAAFGQNASVLGNNPQPIQMPDDRPQHASEHAMGTESSLLSSGTISYAKGEVPLAELASPMYHTPLGDIARAYRKEHAALPKATKVSEN